MNTGYKKRGYHAECHQWLLDKDKEFIRMLLRSKGVEVSTFGDELMLRYRDGRTRSIETMHVGDWAVIGENKEVKIYPDATFHVKYEVV